MQSVTSKRRHVDSTSIITIFYREEGFLKGPPLGGFFLFRLEPLLSLWPSLLSLRLLLLIDSVEETLRVRTGVRKRGRARDRSGVDRSVTALASLGDLDFLLFPPFDDCFGGRNFGFVRRSVIFPLYSVHVPKMIKMLMTNQAERR
jgi:hypothetical protein